MTIPNIMDYARIIFYFWAVYGHFEGNWEPMAAAIVVNGVIDNYDGTVARMLDQTSKLGYIIDCAADMFAVITNTACIAHAVLSSSVIPSSHRCAICGIMHFYGFFFILWCSIASVVMGEVTDYKVFHKSPHAKLYYSTRMVGDSLYLIMQAWWLALYLYSMGVYPEYAFSAVALTSPFVLVKISIEVENVFLQVHAVMEGDIQKSIHDKTKSSR